MKGCAWPNAGRNFSGFSPGLADLDECFRTLLFPQSVYDANEYTEAVNAGRFPVFKGYQLSPRVFCGAMSFAGCSIRSWPRIRVTRCTVRDGACIPAVIILLCQNKERHS